MVAFMFQNYDGTSIRTPFQSPKKENTLETSSIQNMVVLLKRKCVFAIGRSWQEILDGTTVDGRNPAPPGISKTCA